MIFHEATRDSIYFSESNSQSARPPYLPLESERANPPPTSLSHRPPLATTNLASSTGISSCWCDFRILTFCPKQDVHSRAILCVKERSLVKTLLGKKKPVALSCILAAISKYPSHISGQITMIPKPEPSGHFWGLHSALTFHHRLGWPSSWTSENQPTVRVIRWKIWLITFLLSYNNYWIRSTWTQF